MVTSATSRIFGERTTLGSQASRILLVEDDVDMQANVRQILEFDGHVVEAVGSLAQVLERGDLSQYFTILLDRKLPDGTADALLPHLRESAPNSAIIVMTGYTDLDGALAALRHGAADYILKPINPDALRTSVARIAELKRTAEALHREHEFAESLIETARSIVLVVDWQSRVVFFNPFMEELCGRRFDENQGEDWFARFVPDEEHTVVKSVFRSLFEETLPSYSGIYPIFGKHSELRQISWRSKVLKDVQGRIIGVLSTGQDVTDLLEAQEQAIQSARLAAIGQTLSVLSHESRNELLAVKLGLDLLARVVDGQAEAVDMIGELRESHGRLARLFDDVRSFGAPMRLMRSTNNVSRVWQSAWAKLAPLRKNRNGELFEETTGVDLDCYVDEFRLEQVFRNLFENSLAACSDPVYVHVVCSIVEFDGQPALRIAVRDNGPGLTATQKQKVFDAFFTTKQQGSGLGMAIASRIVEAHGGVLTVDDDAYCGAGFVITLPQ